MVVPNILINYSGSSEQRIQAVFHFLFDESPESFEVLGQTLSNDPSSIVRHEAAYILGEKANLLSISPLIKAIEYDPAIIVRHEAALALANLGTLGLPESEKVLIKLLNDPNEDVVDTAEIALQRLQMKRSNESISFEMDSITQIMDDLSSSTKEKRIQASFLLMEEASTESVELLIESLNNEPSPIVKHEIIFSLGESIHYKVVPALIHILETESNFFTVHESLLALGTIGDKRAKNILQRFLHDPNPEIVESAQIGLERLFS